jgi:arylformamidase
MKIIDLSHTLKNNMPVYPGDAPPVFTKVMTHEKDDVQVTRMNITTHHGTHLDCPLHFIHKGLNTENSVLENFYARALIVDCTSYGAGDEIPAAHFHPYREVLEKISWVIIYTGWYRHWGKEEYTRSFPVLSAEATAFLIKYKIKGIGLDVISIDAVDSADFPNHQLTLGNGTYIIENLTNLHAVTEQIFTLSALPLKILDGDGSPIRAAAVVE